MFTSYTPPASPEASLLNLVNLLSDKPSLEKHLKELIKETKIADEAANKNLTSLRETQKLKAEIDEATKKLEQDKKDHEDLVNSHVLELKAKEKEIDDKEFKASQVLINSDLVRQELNKRKEELDAKEKSLILREEQASKADSDLAAREKAIATKERDHAWRIEKLKEIF